MLINITNLHLHIGKHNILNNISLDIARGEMIGLIGPNGAGKTSLLKILANIQTQYSGTYHFNNKPISEYPIKELAKCFGYLAQDATAHWPLKVHTLLELGRLPFQGISQHFSESDWNAIKNAAMQTEVTHLLDRVVTELSGGERARVLLARLFATEPGIIFLDEPIAALDPYHQLHVMEILKEHTSNGGTVVIILHDLNLAARFCDRLILMDKGTIVAQGNMDRLLEDQDFEDSTLNNSLLERTYGIELRKNRQNECYSLTPWKRIRDND